MALAAAAGRRLRADFEDPRAAARERGRPENRAPGTHPGGVAPVRHIAAEGRCWVLGNGPAMRGKERPADFPDRARVFPDLEDWFNPGDSVIVAPDGKLVAGPLHEKHGILFADCDPERASAAKRTLDVAGHYGRPDIFRLEVNREARPPVDFGSGSG